MEKDIEALFSTIVQLGKIIGNQSQKSFEERQSTMLQFMVLSFIDSSPECTMSEVAQGINMSLSSAAQITDRLIKAGLIKRYPDKNDRRITRLSLTEKGIKKHSEIKEEIFIEMKKIFSLVSQKDRRDLIRIHSELLKKLKTDTI